MTFAANKGINVQTDTNQDQGCEPAGGTSGITNACTATSVRGPTETPVTFNCLSGSLSPFTCNVAACNNIGCTSISCDFNIRNCTTNNGVQLTSCTARLEPMTAILSCTETGTGIINSGGVTGGGQPE